MGDNLATGLALWAPNDRLLTIHRPARIHLQSHVLLCSLFSGPQNALFIAFLSRPLANCNCLDPAVVGLTPRWTQLLLYREPKWIVWYDVVLMVFFLF